MELSPTLRTKVIIFLQSLPNLDETKGRRAFVFSAGLDRQLIHQIPFDEPPAQFVPLLVSILCDYERLSDGRNALIAILETAQNYVGHDKKTEGNAIIQELKPYITKNAKNEREQESSKKYQPQSSREKLLVRVQDAWIKGVLEKALHHEILIQIDKEEKSEAVYRPWDIYFRKTSDSTLHLVPKNKPVIDIFDDMRRSLLILGDPGSGKTITLLELARDLIQYAFKDPRLPIPVVFNLSTWEGPEQNFVEWIVKELNIRYRIPKKDGQRWIQDNKLLLLLDGLDEVKDDRRDSCVEGINQFRQEYGLTEMVVCSRLREYEKLSRKLTLQGAILLQPLTEEQINNYLDILGPELASLRVVLQEDAVFQELAKSPLMLSIMVLAYQKLSIENVRTSGTLEDHRKHLFEIYIEQRLMEQNTEIQYSGHQIINWLTWLAERLVQNGQSIFMLEQIQPSWLLTRVQKWIYYFIVILIVTGPIGIFVGLSGWLAIRMGASPSVAPVFGTGLGIASSVAVWLFVSQAFGYINTLFVGLIFGIAFGVTFTMQFNPQTGLFVGVGTGMVAGIIFSLVGRLLKVKLVSSWSTVEITEALKWSWSQAMLGLFTGFIAGALFGGAIGYGTWRETTLNFGIAFGISAGLMGSVISGLSSRKLKPKPDVTNYDVTMHPNQGIWQSGIAAIRIGIVVALLTGVPVGTVNGMVWKTYCGYSGKTYLTVGISSGITIGIAFGLIFGLFFGGLAFIQHFTLRFILYRSGYIPWNLTRILDYAARCIILHKIGGSYSFVHQLLLEYFAGLKKSKSPCGTQ